MASSRIHPELAEAVDQVRVIDTHEHLEEESERLKRHLDFVSLFEQYASDDLRVAGMSDEDWQRCAEPEAPVDEKWSIFEPYYNRARNTAYIKAVEITIRDLYGIDELNEQTCITLTEQLHRRNQPGIVKEILHDRCGIDLALVNALEVPFFRGKTDESLFRQDIGIPALLNWPPPIETLENETGNEVRSFKQYSQAIDAVFAKYGPKADAVKQQSAYWREQKFIDVSDADAERIFNEAIKGADSVDEQSRTALEDWAMHRCIRLATQYDLPVKIHTGYKAGANYMDLEHVKPAKLTNLFQKYPTTRFDVFHIGYPYESELVALCKHYRNVYADMCWTWIIDPIASRHFFKQMLTAAPSNKLVAFGGDYIIAEPVYGHLRIARDQIALALSELVDDQCLTLPEAKRLAAAVLRDNPLELFHIER